MLAQVTGSALLRQSMLLSPIKNLTALLLVGSLLSMGFEKTGYFRIVIIPYVE